MLWRAAPELQLDAFLNTRCLLIGTPTTCQTPSSLFVPGMGTLGCAVARSLLGWGITHFSLVDSGRVSFSNPVRQSLYEFDDCLEQGKYKAEVAADRLRRIHPGVHAESYVFKVPMPGHPPDTQEDRLITKEVTQLPHYHLSYVNLTTRQWISCMNLWRVTMSCSC